MLSSLKSNAGRAYKFSFVTALLVCSFGAGAKTATATSNDEMFAKLPTYQQMMRLSPYDRAEYLHQLRVILYDGMVFSSTHPLGLIVQQDTDADVKVIASGWMSLFTSIDEASADVSSFFGGHCSKPGQVTYGPKGTDGYRTQFTCVTPGYGYGASSTPAKIDQQQVSNDTGSVNGGDKVGDYTFMNIAGDPEHKELVRCGSTDIYTSGFNAGKSHCTNLQTKGVFAKDAQLPANDGPNKQGDDKQVADNQAKADANAKAQAQATPNQNCQGQGKALDGYRHSSEGTCIYAGNMSSYKSDMNHAAGTCKRPDNKFCTDSSHCISCKSSSQIVCNPLIFGALCCTFLLY